MSILGGIGAVGGLLRGASELLTAVRRPGLDRQEFATVLQQQMNQQTQANQHPADATERIQRASAEFVRKRDGNADGLLTVEESGFDRETFSRLDANGDGRLDAAELATPHLEALNRSSHASNSNI